VHVTKSAIAVLGFVLLSLARGTFAAPITFVVKFDESVRHEPASGRLVVYLNRAGLRSFGGPASGFVEHDPQPIFGIDVTNLKPGDTITVDDSASSFPKKLSELPPGKYRAQAVLDMKDENSAWEREAGNLFSDVVDFDSSAPHGYRKSGGRTCCALVVTTSPAQWCSAGRRRRDIGRRS